MAVVPSTVSEALMKVTTVYDVASIRRGAQSVLTKYKSLINTYRGSIPASVVAGRIWLESRGVPTAYNSSTSEAGLLQLWPSTQTTYGVTDPYDPAQNLRAGCAHWNAQLTAMEKANPGLLRSRRGFDYWAIAWLYTAIGGGATTALLKASGARAGSEYNDLRRWVAYQGENLSKYQGSFGSQSAALIAWRIGAAGQFIRAAGIGFGLGDLLLWSSLGYLTWRYWPQIKRIFKKVF